MHMPTYSKHQGRKALLSSGHCVLHHLISGEGQDLRIMAAFPISLSVKSRQTTQPEAYVLVVQFGI